MATEKWMWVVRPVRSVLLLLWLGAGLIILALAFPVLSISRQVSVSSRWSRALLLVLGVRMRVEGDVVPAGELVVANHVSWLDPFVLQAMGPMRFVAKAEILQWPVLGWFAKNAGTVFIRRERQRDVSHVVQRFEHCLSQGVSVAVFPEATTGDASHILPFKTGLFQVAIRAQVACVPVAIRYLQSTAIWIEDMSFTHSMWKVLGQARTDVIVRILPVIPSHQDSTRRDLAMACEQAIANALSLPVRRNQSEIPDDPLSE